MTLDFFKMEILLAALAIRDQLGTQKHRFFPRPVTCPPPVPGRQQKTSLIQLDLSALLKRFLIFCSKIAPRVSAKFFKMHRAEERNHTLILRIRCMSKVSAPFLAPGKGILQHSHKPPRLSAFVASCTVFPTRQYECLLLSH